MMRGTLAFVLLVLLALLGAAVRKRLSRRDRSMPGMQTAVTVLAGVVIGKAGLQLFPENLLELLRPVILLGLSWIGLLIGLQFDLRILRSLRTWQRRAGFLIPMAAGGITGALALAGGLGGQVSVLLAGVATVSSPRLIDHLSRMRPPADRAAMRLLLMVASLSSASAVLLFGVGSTLITDTGEAFGPAASLVVGVGVAVILGYATILLLHGENEEIHVLALLVGVMALTAGASVLTGAEAMLMAAISGAVIANRSRFPHRILRAAHAIETPMLTAILLLLGAWWQPSPPSLSVLLVLVVGRGAAVLGGGRVLEAVAKSRHVAVEAAPMGAGLLLQGPLALAFLMASIQKGHGGTEMAAGVFAALVINHFAGGLWTRRVLFEKEEPRGEIHA